MRGRFYAPIGKTRRASRGESTRRPVGDVDGDEPWPGALESIRRCDKRRHPAQFSEASMIKEMRNKKVFLILDKLQVHPTKLVTA
ncbi:MAG: hypothetical protein VB140_03065 [Burkholderia sp.]